jgi:hypothetical protein
MQPKQVAGIAGIVGLGALGLFGVGFDSHTRSKRSLLQKDEFKVEVDGDADFYEEAFIDPWEDESENSTAEWKEFNKQLGVEITEDDVMVKQRRVNWNRLKESQLVKLHDNMQAEYAKHIDALNFFNEISGVDYGRRDPSEFGTEMNDEGDYSGYARMAPQAKSFIDSLGCKADGSNLWRNGKNAKLNLWALFPSGVPLFTEQENHVSDFGYYWKWFMKMAENWPTEKGVAQDIRFSLGTYGNSAVFTPRGYRFRANVPWQRMNRFYRKPKMSAAKPKVMSSLRSLLTYLPRYGVSTPSAGDDCVLFWFFHDVPRDLNDFLVPEEFEMVSELHTLCTVMPVIVGPNANSDMWKKFVANLMPGMRSKHAKDPELSGAFYVDKFEDLMNEDLIAHMNYYQCLVANRATCRLVNNAWIPPSSDNPTGADPTEGFRAVAEYDDISTDGPTTDAPTTEGTTNAPTTAKIPEIDSCCGHDGFSATPFDSELRTCCEDGMVRKYEFEGEDPCLASDEFFKK